MFGNTFRNPGLLQVQKIVWKAISWEFLPPDTSFPFQDILTPIITTLLTKSLCFCFSLSGAHNIYISNTIYYITSMASVYM